MLPLNTTTQGLEVKIGVTSVSITAKQNGGAYLSLSRDLTEQKTTQSRFPAAREGPAGRSCVRVPPSHLLPRPLSLRSVLSPFHSFFLNGFVPWAE